MEELKLITPTARKEHTCMWCGCKIKKGEKYERKTIKWDGQVYDWICHLECEELTGILNMFDSDLGDGINKDIFLDYIDYWVDKHHCNKEGVYDEGFNPKTSSYHEIVLKILEEERR